MLRSFAICNSIEKNHLHEHGVSEPIVKALVRGLASSSACTTTGDLSGCQVARVKSTRVWSLIYFLNMFKGYSTMKWFVSAWTIWGLRAEWTLNMGTEASKGLTLLWWCRKISQDRKNDSGLVTTAGFALGGRLASSLTEGTTNVN